MTCPRCGYRKQSVNTNGHRPNDCPFSYKYSAKGQLQRNRKHVCGPECSWGREEVSAWLRDTPYPGFDTPPRLVPVLPCTRCSRKRSDHYEAVSNDAGLFVGFREIKECSYTTEHEPPTMGQLQASREAVA